MATAALEDYSFKAHKHQVNTIAILMLKSPPAVKKILPNYQDATKEINTKTRRNTSTKSYTVDFKNLASCILSVPRNILTEVGPNLVHIQWVQGGGGGSKRLDFLFWQLS